MIILIIIVIIIMIQIIVIRWRPAWSAYETVYGRFSEFNVCFCGLDPSNLKFETVRTHRLHICF